jgi:hypothetical protein
MTAPERVALGDLGRSGRDPRSGAEYLAALVRETEASLRRDPKRWTRRKTIEVPKDRSTSPGARRDEPEGPAPGATAPRRRSRG